VALKDFTGRTCHNMKPGLGNGKIKIKFVALCAFVLWWHKNPLCKTPSIDLFGLILKSEILRGKCEKKLISWL
jgi:hypothetical protein